MLLPCRYYRVYTDPDTPCEEANFHFVEKGLPVPVEQSALVLVDVWAVHYIDSWLDRARAVTRESIVPALSAARKAGMLVVHAPSPTVADKYVESPAAVSLPREPIRSDWPPADFRGIYRKDRWAAFGRNQEPRLPGVYKWYEKELLISPLAEPRSGEPIIHTGDQMHALLAEHRIMHLIYAGFATNWCLIGRDYGIMAMNERGYNVIMIRDATTGIEFHDSVDHLGATAMTIREIETKYGWSCDTAAFVKACNEAE